MTFSALKAYPLSVNYLHNSPVTAFKKVLIFLISLYKILLLLLYSCRQRYT